MMDVSAQEKFSWKVYGVLDTVQNRTRLQTQDTLVTTSFYMGVKSIYWYWWYTSESIFKATRYH